MVRNFLFCVAMGMTVQAADLAGQYELQGVREVGSELLLKPDGKFEFMLAYGAADYWAKGTWRVEKDIVLLKSDERKRPPAFRLVRSSSEKASTVRVHVVGPGGQKVPDIEVKVTTARGPLTGRTDSDGIAVFENAAEVKSVEFEIPVFEFRSGPLEVNAAHNDFTFEINGEAITEVQFKDERLTIDGASIVMHQFGGQAHEMRYTKH
jgi:hypothetical protein